MPTSKALLVLTFRPMHGGEEGELWASARLEEDMDSWTGWSGGRPGKRTGSPIPEGTELSVCGGAQRVGRAGAGEGGERAHSFAAPKETPGGCWGPRAGRAYFPKRNSSYVHSVPSFLFGILRMCTPNSVRGGRGAKFTRSSAQIGGRAGPWLASQIY